MKQIKTIGLALWLAVVSYTSQGGGTSIISLNGNGILTWTNSFTNALFTVKWASSLEANPTNTSWRDDWTTLKNFSTTTGVTSVAVPMFYRVQCLPANVRLGDAFFDDTSDWFPTNCYLYVPGLMKGAHSSVTNFYDGYGNYVGYTYKQVYVYKDDNNRVSGVNCIVVYKTGNPYVSTGDYWAAMDILGNVRLLKYVQGTNILYEASPVDTPPIILPSNVTIGQNWNRFGDWNTVTDTNAVFGGYTNLLEIQWVGSFDVDYTYYQLGLGQVLSRWYDDPIPTGWQLRTP